MATIKKQYYGIKFPFSNDNLMGFFLDLNIDTKDKVISDITHVILTPKRTRIRKPDFGTNLLKFIFEPNDEYTWDDIKNEIRESVKKYVSNTEINDVNMIEEDNGIYLDINFSIKKGNKVENNRTVIKI